MTIANVRVYTTEIVNDGKLRWLDCVRAMSKFALNVIAWSDARHKYDRQPQSRNYLNGSGYTIWFWINISSANTEWPKDIARNVAATVSIVNSTVNSTVNSWEWTLFSRWFLYRHSHALSNLIILLDSRYIYAQDLLLMDVPASRQILKQSIEQISGKITLTEINRLALPRDIIILGSRYYLTSRLWKLVNRYIKCINNDGTKHTRTPTSVPLENRIASISFLLFLSYY